MTSGRACTMLCMRAIPFLLLASTALAMVHNVEGMVWFAGLVFLVGRAARVLSRPAVRRRLDQFAGLVFIGFGLLNSRRIDWPNTSN